MGHPSWECSCANLLNFEVRLEPEASELPKSFVLDSSDPSSKIVQGEGYEKDHKKKRATTCVQYTSSAKSRLFMCNYSLDDTNEELMKLMEEVLKRGYKQWRYDVERS
ncbi:unnamed protein product [Malus baccata var. baccata]